MTTPDNFRSLCSEIFDLLDYHIPQDDRPTCWDPWRNRARVLLSSASDMKRPTLKEVSAWVDCASSEAPRNHWSRRVDHHDAMAIALAALDNWSHKSNQPVLHDPGKPTSQELFDLWKACNSPSVFARAVLERWGNLVLEPTPTLTPSPGYERGDGSMDGAQMVDGEWWHPVMGCDSLSHVIDRANYLLANKSQ